MKGDGRIGFRIEPDMKAWWERYADRSGIKMTAFICGAVNHWIMDHEAALEGMAERPGSPGEGESGAKATVFESGIPPATPSSAAEPDHEAQSSPAGTGPALEPAEVSTESDDSQAREEGAGEGAVDASPRPPRDECAKAHLHVNGRFCRVCKKARF